MKILFIGNNGHGLYQFRKEFIAKLVASGNNVCFTVPKDDYVEAIVQLQTTYYPIEYNRRGMNPIEDFKLLLGFVRIIRDSKPDMVLSYTIKPNVYGGLACRMTKTPYIANVTGLGTSIENLGLLQKIVLKLYKTGLKKARCVFFQNEPNRVFFQEWVIDKRVRTRIIPGSGVNLSEHCLEPYPTEADGIRFLFIGRIMKDKGVEELFAATERVKKRYPTVRFRIIGGCDEDYNERIEALSKAGVIEPLGFQKNVHKYIKDSHCTILPSYHEGTANVLLESAACGRPVIATRVTGCSETFDDGITGLGCDVKSAESLVEAVERFIRQSPEEHEAMGKAGRAKMEREYDRQIVVDAYLDEIEKTKPNNPMNTDNKSI